MRLHTGCRVSRDESIKGTTCTEVHFLLHNSNGSWLLNTSLGWLASADVLQLSCLSAQKTFTLRKLASVREMQSRTAVKAFLTELHVLGSSRNCWFRTSNTIHCCHWFQRLSLFLQLFGACLCSFHALSHLYCCLQLQFPLWRKTRFDRSLESYRQNGYEDLAKGTHQTRSASPDIADSSGETWIAGWSQSV